MTRRGRVHYDPANDYYLILGVGPTATTNEIQGAFRRQAKRLHPDRNPDGQATAQFQRLSEAYAILGDPASRAEYDTLREIRRAGSGNFGVPRRTTAAPLSESLRLRPFIAGLWNGPYRYVALVLILVVLLNISLAVATSQNRSADTSAIAPTQTQAAPTAFFSDVCSAADRFLAPVNNAVLSNTGFMVVGVAQGAYQLDWAPVPLGTNGTLESLHWTRLTSAGALPPNRVLADSSRIAALIAFLPRPGQLALRLTVIPIADQPVQQCEIAISLDQ